MIEIAHRQGVPVLLDGAQATPHFAVDVRELDCDFFAFSAHKNYGPTGIGVLYGKAELLEAMPPYQGGGDMIASVTFEKTTYNTLPYKFEAGTPYIAGVIGLGATIDYVKSVGIDAIVAYENDVVAYAAASIGEIPGVKLIGNPKVRAGVVSFIINDVHPHDAGTVLDREGIAIRTGHHCSQPVMDFYGVPATCRASFGMYNTRGEVDQLVAGIHKVQEVFK
jgi:cysteine desulfurase/selenocysteine lyase